MGIPILVRFYVYIEKTLDLSNQILYLFKISAQGKHERLGHDTVTDYLLNSTNFDNCDIFQKLGC